MIPTKIKFRRVALQVLFADVMERAIKAAFQDRKARLYSIRSRIATGIFTRAVIDYTMPRKLLADLRLNGSFVRH